MSSPVAISQTGRCHCGAVKYKVEGNIRFNVFCHCKNCSRAIGMNPIHLIAVTPKSGLTILEGEDMISCNGTTVTRCFCKKCGSNVHQGPVSADFRAVYPVGFHLDEQQLPKQYQPSMHINYESRLVDWHDDLPKFKGFPGSGVMLTNNGEEIPPPPADNDKA